MGFVFDRVTACIVYFSWQANEKGTDNTVHWLNLSAKWLVLATVPLAGLWQYLWDAELTSNLQHLQIFKFLLHWKKVMTLTDFLFISAWLHSSSNILILKTALHCFQMEKGWKRTPRNWKPKSSLFCLWQNWSLSLKSHHEVKYSSCSSYVE